jgi:light-regulated signal transduction histidine kinase (bacteriophytochrome)
MNGFELCSHIRSDENLKHIPVILLTSLSNAEDVIKGLECGADNFITKPYDEDYLIRRIQYIFANWHLRELDWTRMGIEVYFAGKRHFITSDRLQILNLLLSTYETAVQRNEALVSAQDELRKTNEQLNRQTTQLEEANKDLEAFSYSVSHDLRAPLRTIGSFSQALSEDCADQLSSEGQDYLRRITNGVARMNQLIDDLLRLFGVTRGTFERQQVNLSEIAEGFIEDFRRSQPGRVVDVSIAPELIVKGDESLLRNVMQNLLSNAWKFTEKKAHARIEFGIEQQRGTPVYFVRDNGAGFNMAYADKLFSPFQRMHSASEFAGTGIGLATVKKIIQRHGGRIWVESKPDHGATFYFTL